MGQIFYDKYDISFNRYFLCFFLQLSCLWLLCACKNDEEQPISVIPNTNLVNNEIIISNISDIPQNTKFNKVKVKITGTCWETIDNIETDYSNGKVILSLPAEFPTIKLQKALRSDNHDYCGCWYAQSNHTNARVAVLGDIIAYDNNKQVGRIYLTDWSGTGSALYKSFIYYCYADQPFSLTGSDRTYQYETSFKKGWNAYAHVNQKESDDKSVLCTTSIAKEKVLTWHFESGAY